MRDILEDLDRWRAAGKSIAMATVLQTWGSAPRPAGAKMALTADGLIAGSVSGGCVENAVIEAGREVLKTGLPQLLHYGVSDDTAWHVGLACGGTIDVFVEPLAADLYERVRGAILAERPAAVATVIQGPDTQLGRKLLLLDDGSTAGAISAGALDATRATLAGGSSRRVADGGTEIFVDVLLPPPRLVIVGGVHIAIALVALAKTLGFRTVLVEPREAFGNATRFPNVDRIVSAWPDRALEEIGLDGSTAVAVLTHDPKLDDPALLTALRSRAFYVGALGSRRTQEKRHARLREAGVSEESLSRLYAPIGLDLGGRSPEEIALAVMAQIVAARNKK